MSVSDTVLKCKPIHRDSISKRLLELMTPWIRWTSLRMLAPRRSPLVQCRGSSSPRRSPHRSPATCMTGSDRADSGFWLRDSRFQHVSARRDHHGDVAHVHHVPDDVAWRGARMHGADNQHNSAWKHSARQASGNIGERRGQVLRRAERTAQDLTPTFPDPATTRTPYHAGLHCRCFLAASSPDRRRGRDASSRNHETRCRESARQSGDRA